MRWHGLPESPPATQTFHAWRSASCCLMFCFHSSAKLDCMLDDQLFEIRWNSTLSALPMIMFNWSHPWRFVQWYCCYSNKAGEIDAVWLGIAERTLCWTTNFHWIWVWCALVLVYNYSTFGWELRWTWDRNLLMPPLASLNKLVRTKKWN